MFTARCAAGKSRQKGGAAVPPSFTLDPTQQFARAEPTPEPHQGCVTHTQFTLRKPHAVHTTQVALGTTAAIHAQAHGGRSFSLLEAPSRTACKSRPRTNYCEATLPQDGGWEPVSHWSKVQVVCKRHRVRDVKNATLEARVLGSVHD